MQWWKTQNRHSLVTQNLYCRNYKITNESYYLERGTGIWWMWRMAGENMNLHHGNVYVSTSESFGVWSVYYFFSQLPFWFQISHVTASPLFPVNHMNFGIWTENKSIWSYTERTCLKRNKAETVEPGFWNSYSSSFDCEDALVCSSTSSSRKQDDWSSTCLLLHLDLPASKEGLAEGIPF